MIGRLVQQKKMRFDVQCSEIQKNPLPQIRMVLLKIEKKKYIYIDIYLARAILMRHPPEKSLVGVFCILAVNPKPCKM